MISNIPSIAPVGLPKGVDPRIWRQAIEKRLNEVLDQSLALITALDMMEVDPDFEENGDDEPWLGWAANGPREDPTGGDGRELDDTDAEEECEDEGAQCDDEGVIEGVTFI
jgi:hypothetical protein